jgi:hypothetical protein
MTALACHVSEKVKKAKELVYLSTNMGLYHIIE